MPAPRPTVAAIRRALEAAREAGAGEVIVDGPVIRILVQPEPGKPRAGGVDCDDVFGKASG